MATTPATTGLSRVFLIQKGARADRAPVYHSCMRAGAVEQSYGDVTKIECPDPNNPDEFIEVGEISDADERPTTQLIGRYPAKEASKLKEIADDTQNRHDVHINIGLSRDVSLFGGFDKKVIFETGKITSYSTDEVGALESGERTAVNETGDVSGKVWYEVLPLAFAERAASLISNEIIDVIYYNDKIYALTKAAGGSPSTPADILYGIINYDRSISWYAHDIDTLSASEQPNALARVGDYIVVVSNETDSLHYAALTDFDGLTDPTWTEVSTGFNASGSPNDIWSVGNTAFICGDGGYVYKCTDPTAGVTALDEGVAVSDNLNAIHAINENYFVAVGNSGAIVKSENGTTVTAVTPRPTGAGVHLNCVWVKGEDEKQWFIGSAAGNLHYTVDEGVTFATKSFSGSGSGQIRDIAFASKSVGYLAHDTTTPAGRIFRTYNNGQAWTAMPEGSANLTTNDRITALAVNPKDVNFVVGGGLADDGTDGILLVGED